jgi:hypothetical protein
MNRNVCRGESAYSPALRSIDAHCGRTQHLSLRPWIIGVFGVGRSMSGIESSESQTCPAAGTNGVGMPRRACSPPDDSTNHYIIHGFAHVGPSSAMLYWARSSTLRSRFSSEQASWMTSCTSVRQSRAVLSALRVSTSADSGEHHTQPTTERLKI